jgi:uncharacterized membrane-anchored protein YhcB (DUF1043 family)
MKQLTLFDMEKDTKQEMQDLKAEWEKTRRSLYARQSEMQKMYQELAHEYQIMKLNICKGKIVI